MALNKLFEECFNVLSSSTFRVSFHQPASEGDLVHAPMTKATCNNSDHAFCFVKWDCRNPLKNDI